MSRTYLLTVNTVLSKVRRLIQDETTPYRYTDAELLGWLNDAITTMVSLKPGLFTTIATHTCSDGYRQTVVNTNAHMLVDVIGVVSADLASLTRFVPGWQTATPGAIVNWMRDPQEQLSFFCYPPAVEGQSLSVEIVEKPAELTATTDRVPVPESYEPALVDYCVGMAQSKDDEAIDMNRMQQFMTNFAGRVKGT